MKQAQSVTLLFDERLCHKAASFYDASTLRKEPPSPHIEIFAEGDGFVFSLYKKIKNGYRSALFQGEKAETEASLWISFGAIRQEKKPKPAMSYVEEERTNEPSLFPQIGSDEVGTGDFFGPIIVAAAFVKKTDLPRLKELGVTDSKKMNDAHILSIGPSLIKEFEYSQLCLDNKRYNEVHDDGLNMNAMKAKMHNRALSNLAQKHPSAYRYMDEFAKETLYYSYLRDEDKPLKGIIFQTKGESHFPSVALASVIARYSFLRHMEELRKECGYDLPLGAGAEVDAMAERIAKEKGLDYLETLSKANFANRRKLTID